MKISSTVRGLEETAAIALCTDNIKDFFLFNVYRSVSSGERSSLIAIVSQTRCVRSDIEREFGKRWRRERKVSYFWELGCVSEKVW